MSNSFGLRPLEVTLAEHPHDQGSNPLLHRIRSEFLEMPGLRLTPAQAARLWAVDHETSKRILDRLTITGFLFRNREGAYLRAMAA
jgi:RecB family exonuclease